MASDTLLRIADRSDLRGNIRANDSVDVGINAILKSNILVRKGATLQSGARVTGDMTLGRGLVRIGSAQVSGTVKANQVVDRCVFTSDPVVSGTTDRVLAGLQNLAPGDYRDVRVQSGAILHVRPGLYRLRRLIVDPDGILEIDAQDGLVEIEVAESFSFANRARVRGMTGMSDSLVASKVSLYSHQTAELRVEADAIFRGRLRVPRAMVVVGGRVNFLGGLYGRQVAMDPDVVFRDALPSAKQIVRIDGARRFWTNAAQVTVSWTVDGVLQTAQTLETLPAEGAHRIIRCSGSACDTVLAMVDRTAPVVAFTSPAEAAQLNTPAIDLVWTIDGAVQSERVALVEGLNTLMRSATDSAGNTGSATRHLTLDTQPPVIAILSPVDGFLTNESKQTLTWSVDGVERSEPIELMEGENLVERKATDVAGNVASAKVRLYLDTKPPVVAILSPADGLVTNQSQQTLKWSVDGLEHTAQIQLTEGENLIERQATDAAGNTSSAQVHVVLDTKPPVISILAPEDGFLTNQPQQTLKWLVDGVEQSDQIQLTEGENLLERKATDAAGNVASAKVRLVLDTQSPVVSILAPADGFVTNQARQTLHWSVDGVERLEEIELIEGENLLERRASDAAGNTSSAQVHVILDTQPPVVSILAPKEGSVTNQARQTLRWSVDGVERLEEIDLIEGENVLERRASDAAGNVGVAQIHVILDTQAPEVSILSPQDGFVTSQPDLTLRWSVDGIEREESLHLSEGVNRIDRTATDPVGNVGRASIQVTLDTHPPVIEFLSPKNGDIVHSSSISVRWSADGVEQTSGLTEQLHEGRNVVERSARDAAGNLGTGSIEVNYVLPVAVLPEIQPASGRYTTPQSIGIGSSTPGATIRYTLDGTDPDETSPIFTGSFLVEKSVLVKARAFAFGHHPSTVASSLYAIAPEGVLPEPVAPPNDKTLPTDFKKSIGFLYQGPDAIQKDVVLDSLDAKRLCVLRGVVIDRAGAPVSGVKITANGHEEFGYTFSRVGGNFELVVNGGGPVVLNYEKDGFLPVQRTIQTSWLDYALVDTVAMIGFDPLVTPVDLSKDRADVVFAQGSEVTDQDGTRRGTLMFPTGLAAEMEMPDGSRKPLMNMQVRVTEYTVGERGLEAMPGPLPSTSAYTYAAELSVDEAVAAGASHVVFNKPVAFYLDNFLKFPVGIQVPLGWYDRTRSVWLPEPDGRVIKLLGVNSAGLMDIDMNGDDVAEAEDSLAKLSITNEERAALPRNWPAGTILWRLALQHFSTIDPNFAVVAPKDAEDPKEIPDSLKEEDDGSCPDTGCEIATESQNLREKIRIPGTDMDLVYHLDRTRGRRVERTLDIPLVGKTFPSSLKRVELTISVLGREWFVFFSPSSNLHHLWTWDAVDGFDRPVVGYAEASVRVTYIYDGLYAGPPNLASTFSYPSGLLIDPTLRSRREIRRSKTMTFRISGNAADHGFGNGWGMSSLHEYIPNSGTFISGEGGAQQLFPQDEILTWIAGAGGYSSPSPPDDGSIGDAKSYTISSAGEISALPNGDVFVNSGTKIYRIDRNGGISTIGKDAGSKLYGYDFPDSANINDVIMYVSKMKALPNGDLIVVHDWSDLCRISNGKIYRISANKYSTPLHPWQDGALAKDVNFPEISDIELGDHGEIYVLPAYGIDRVIKIDPSGHAYAIIGGPNAVMPSDFIEKRDEIPALEFAMPYWAYTNGLTKDPEGNLVIYAWGAFWKYTNDGVMERYIGKCFDTDRCSELFGSVVPADSAVTLPVSSQIPPVGFDQRGAFYFSPNIYFNTKNIYRINDHGYVHRWISDVGGSENQDVDGWPARSVRLTVPADGVAFLPDGSAVVYDQFRAKIFRISRPTMSKQQFLVRGEEIYFLDELGRLSVVRSAKTNSFIRQYLYGTTGEIASIRTAKGVVDFERDAMGRIQSIVAPTGERTELQHDADGNVVRVNLPDGSAWTFEYLPGSIIRQIQRPDGERSIYEIDSMGRLTSDLRHDGALQTISRVREKWYRKVEIQKIDGTKKVYVTQGVPEGGYRQTTIDQLGQETISREISGRISVDSLPDGTVRTTQLIPDPQWGGAHFLRDVITQHPDGHIDSLLHRRAVVLRTADDPLSMILSIDSTIESGNRITVESYDAVQHMRIKKYPEGRSDTSYYDTLGNVIEFRTTAMYPVKYAYNERSNKVRESVLTPQGLLLRKAWVYDPYNRVVEEYEQPDPSGPVQLSASYSYDAAGHLLTRTDGEGRTWQYRYDQWGNRNLEIAPDGAASFAVFNELGQRIALYDPIEMSKPENSRKAQRWFYDIAGRDTLHIDVAGRKTRKSYDLLGNLVMEIGIHKDTTRRGFDKDGRVIWERSPLGRLTYQDFDIMGRLTRVIRKVGDAEPVPDDDDQVTEYEYDLRGNQTREVVDGRIVARRGYDAFDRLVADTNASGVVTITEYDPAGRPWRTSRSDGSWQESHFDGFGRVASAEDALGIIREQRYDMVGRVLESRTPGLGSSRTFFDRSGLPVRIIDSAGVETQIRRDACGRDTMIIDGLGHGSIKRLDVLGRPHELVDARGFVQTMEYDELGRLSRLFDAGDQDGDGVRHVTEFVYEDLNQADAVERRTTIYSDGSRDLEESDVEGQIVRRVDARGVETRIEYNELGQQMRLDLRDPATGLTSATIFTYNPHTHQLVSVKKGATEVSYAYRADGRLESEAQSAMGRSYRLQYAYDDFSRQRTVTHPDGNVVVQTYDERSRLSHVSLGATSLLSLEYEAMRLKGKLLGNGIVAAYQYDRAAKVTSFGYERSGAELPHFALTYDAAGRINSFQRENMPSRSETYGYTEDGQLSAWKVGAIGSDGTIGSASQFQEWPGLDSRGNWRMWRENGRMETREHSAMNELSARASGVSSVPLSYAGGYLQNDGTFRYEWNLEGLLSAVKTSSGQLVAQYEYDGLGRRVGRLLAGGATTVSVYDGRQCVWQLVQSAGGDTAKSFAYGSYIDEPVAMVRNWGSSSDTAYFLQGNNYNVEALTDRTGQIVERYEYTPYGEPTIYTGKGVDGKWYTSDDVTSSRSPRGNEVLFQGRQIDWESGLYYYRARMYSPGLGRFVSRDPIRFASGDRNLYRFVGNMPGMAVDPSGLVKALFRLKPFDNGDTYDKLTSRLGACTNGACTTSEKDLQCKCDCKKLSCSMTTQATISLVRADDPFWKKPTGRFPGFDPAPRGEYDGAKRHELDHVHYLLMFHNFVISNLRKEEAKVFGSDDECVARVTAIGDIVEHNWDILDDFQDQFDSDILDLDMKYTDRDGLVDEYESPVFIWEGTNRTDRGM